jgi:hypothetical protein
MRSQRTECQYDEPEEKALWRTRTWSRILTRREIDPAAARD